MLNFNGDLNLGMSIRSSVVFGAREIFIFGKKSYDKRTTVGAQNYIDITKYDLLDEFLDELRFTSKYNYEPIFIEQGGAKFSPTNVYWKSLMKARNPIFIFGAESEGIPQRILDKFKGNIYTIQQLGVLRSLNVSACVSIVAAQYSEYLTSYPTPMRA